MEKEIITIDDTKDIIAQHSDTAYIIAKVNQDEKAEVSFEYQDINHIVGLVSAIISGIAYEAGVEATDILSELMRIEKAIPVEIQIKGE